MSAAVAKRPHRRVGRPSAKTAPLVDAALLDAAGEVFREKGFARASMKEIAVRAHASKQTLYSRFPNKADLYETLMEQRTSEILASVSKMLEKEQGPEVALTLFGKAAVNAFMNPEVQRLQKMVIADSAMFPNLARSFFERGPKRARQLLIRYLTRQVERGALKIMEIDFAAEQFMGSLTGAVMMRSTLCLPPLLSKSAAVDRWVSQAVHTFLAAYLTSSRRMQVQGQ